MLRDRLLVGAKAPGAPVVLDLEHAYRLALRLHRSKQNRPRKLGGPFVPSGRRERMTPCIGNRERGAVPEAGDRAGLHQP